MTPPFLDVASLEFQDCAYVRAPAEQAPRGAADTVVGIAAVTGLVACRTGRLGSTDDALRTPSALHGLCCPANRGTEFCHRRRPHHSGSGWGQRWRATIGATNGCGTVGSSGWRAAGRRFLSVKGGGTRCTASASGPDTPIRSGQRNAVPRWTADYPLARPLSSTGGRRALRGPLARLLRPHHRNGRAIPSSADRRCLPSAGLPPARHEPRAMAWIRRQHHCDGGGRSLCRRWTAMGRGAVFGRSCSGRGEGPDRRCGSAAYAAGIPCTAK